MEMDMKIAVRKEIKKKRELAEKVFYNGWANFSLKRSLTVTHKQNENFLSVAEIRLFSFECQNDNPFLKLDEN